MGENSLYYKYSDFLKKHYYTKVYKLPVNLPVSCPNRIDGSGCTFCSADGTGFEAMASSISMVSQLEHTKEYIHKRYKAEKFIAYFQNYTNTFMPLKQLSDYLEEVRRVDDIVEIDISTRPDCIREDYLDMLSAFSEKTGIPIGIELGLQSANYHTLASIQRGHGLAEYVDSCLRIKRRGFFLCTHVILNLPGDELTDAVETSKLISVLQNDLVKIHSLYIAKGTEMGRLFQRGELAVCSKEEYFRRLRYFLEYLNPDIAIERLFSRIPEKDALFSNWQTSWWKLQDEFTEYMTLNSSFQGKQFNYMNGPALQRFI